MTCKDCLKNAECSGSHEISVNSGYWRSSFQSENIIKCLNLKACVGGFLPVDYTMDYNNNSFPLCDKGYGGNLCH
jgi:hypothetical protein